MNFVMNRAKGSNSAIGGQEFEDPRMNLQLDQNISHGDDSAADHARLEQLFSRRAQKAETYCRVLLTTRTRPMVLGHQAS